MRRYKREILIVAIILIALTVILLSFPEGRELMRNMVRAKYPFMP